MKKFNYMSPWIIFTKTLPIDIQIRSRVYNRRINNKLSTFNAWTSDHWRHSSPACVINNYIARRYNFHEHLEICAILCYLVVQRTWNEEFIPRRFTWTVRKLKVHLPRINPKGKREFPSIYPRIENFRVKWSFPHARALNAEWKVNFHPLPPPLLRRKMRILFTRDN